MCRRVICRLPGFLSGLWEPLPPFAPGEILTTRGTNLYRPTESLAIADWSHRSREIVAAWGTELPRSLQHLLETGSPFIQPGKPWTPHRPERPEKSEGGIRFQMKSDFSPSGDQPTAIGDLVDGIPRRRDGVSRAPVAPRLAHHAWHDVGRTVREVRATDA